MPKAPPKPDAESAPRFSGRLLFVLALLGMPLAIAALVTADWYRTIPADAKATYVGRDSCIKCHQQEHDAWHGSHHDLAMDEATAEFVLGDFNDATLEHYGVTSRMFTKDGKYFVHTEGEGGEFKDYEVKWVFGVEPLQQYLVELDRAKDAEEHEIGRVQVLPVVWDTTRNEWFYLDPPDVHEKLEPGDRLHWTGTAQNWNRMCADCHSTHLQKNFNPKTGKYHTTFSEIDVSCEACHGPGSLHVELAERNSLFWDRERGYALAKLKGEKNKTEVETCARCHVRRARVIGADYEAGEAFYDYFCNALIREGLYHADGQIRDEVYVHGSFIQSKMFHKNVRCSDCHDPHSTKVKFQDNRLCTECHLAEAHTAGKFDTPTHHHHPVESVGASCVECHMPETTYMEVDPRRDHSLRIPRPDLSVKFGTPNACTGCHLDASKLSDEAKDAFSISHTRDPLSDYASWLRVAAEAKDPEVRAEVQAEIDRVNEWSLEHTRKWYGDERENMPNFTAALTAAWRGEPEAEEKLIAVVEDQDASAMGKASALVHLAPYQSAEAEKAAKEALEDMSPLVRFAALSYFEQQINALTQGIRDADMDAARLEREADAMEKAVASMELDNPQSKAFIQQRIQQIRGQAGQARGQAAQAAEYLEKVAKTPAPLLSDPVRLVRTEAGRILAPVDGRLLNGEQRRTRATAIDEYIAGLMVDNDWAMAHHSLGLLYERMADEPDEYEKAIDAYERAIAVEADVTGPRSNLAELLERLSQQEVDPAKAQKLHLRVRELRRDETELLGQEAALLPDHAEVQYRYGLSLYLIGEEDKATEVLARAHELAPESVDILLRLALLYKKRQQWDEAINATKKLIELQPDNQMFQHVLRETMQEQQQAEANSQPDTP